jgi:hypothetical protein
MLAGLLMRLHRLGCGEGYHYLNNMVKNLHFLQTFKPKSAHKGTINEKIL